MHLLLRHSQRDDGWLFSSITFELDARLDLTPDEHELFDRYGLATSVVYDSDAREQYEQTALEYQEAAGQTSQRRASDTVADHISSAFTDIAASLWNNALTAGYGILADLSLRITLGSLMQGQHVESNSLEEILAVKKAITDAVEYLANYLQVAVTFDGREELTEYGNE